jgi:glycosyltransferase involved in cell wall biosynthesis
VTAGHHPYTDPWRAPAPQRLRELSTGQRRVAYFYHTPDTSTFRYRAYNMVQALNRYGDTDDVSATYFCSDDAGLLDDFLAAAHVIVFCRSKYSELTSRILALARRSGIRVLFDVDDLIFDTRYTHLVTQALSQDMSSEEAWDVWFAYTSRIGALMRMCDGAITTNRLLAERVEDFAQIPARIVPNFLNDEQLRVSAKIRARKAFVPRDPGSLSLGYFSGTPTHTRDYHVIAGTLTELLDRYPKVRLTIVGFAPSEGIPERQRKRMQVVPLQDFVSLQELIGRVDLNLVPLQDNIFTNCKSELKYFEAAVVCTATMASPTYTYRAAINDGVNGFLVNAQEWRTRLTALAESPESLPAIAARAYDAVRKDYFPASHVAGIRDALLFNEGRRAGTIGADREIPSPAVIARPV